MSVVIYPEVFDEVHFNTPGYRVQAEMLLRGLDSNGLLLLDPNGRLLDEMNKKLESLSAKNGQQLRIRLEELRKNERRRILTADRTKCSCPPKLTLLKTATTVHTSLKTDSLIIDSNSSTEIESRGDSANDLVVLGSYISSNFEKERHDYLDKLPPIDKMKPGDFDKHMIRLTRFAKRLRFYDKQIGKGSSLSGFRDGIGKILSLWTANAHYPSNTLSVEIYTCFQKTHKETDAVHSTILSSLIRKLASDYGLKITFYFKEDSPLLTHDRFLQTDSVAIAFSKGFDFLEADGSLHRCTVKIDNGAYDHLREYRDLKDFKPPVTVNP